MAENIPYYDYPLEPDPKLKPLEILVGTWEIEVKHPKIPGPTHGTAIFEWLPGGKFLIEQISLSNPVFPFGLSRIGYDEETGDYIQHYFDSRGVIRNYHLSMKDNVLKVWRNDPDFSQRFTGTFSDDGNTMTYSLEIAKDNVHWEHDFDQIYRRVK